MADLPNAFCLGELSKTESGKAVLRAGLEAVVAQRNLDQAFTALSNILDKQAPATSVAKTVATHGNSGRWVDRAGTASDLAVVAAIYGGAALAAKAAGSMGIQAASGAPIQDPVTPLSPTGNNGYDLMIGGTSMIIGATLPVNWLTLKRRARAFTEAQRTVNAAEQSLVGAVWYFAPGLSAAEAADVAGALLPEVKRHQTSVDRVVARGDQTLGGDELGL